MDDNKATPLMQSVKKFITACNEELIKNKLQQVGENDGICKVIYFDETFNGVLENTNTPDLIACYLGEDGNISFSAHSKDDNEEIFPISYEELPREVQIKVFNYIENYQDNGKVI